MTVSVPRIEKLLAEATWPERLMSGEELAALTKANRDLRDLATASLPALIAAVKAARAVADSEGVEESSTKGRAALIALDEALAPFSFEEQA